MTLSTRIVCESPALAATTTVVVTAIAIAVTVTATTAEDNKKNNNPRAAVVAVTENVTHMRSSFRLHYILLQIHKLVTFIFNN